MADADLLAARLQVSTLQSALDRAHGQVRERDAAIAALNQRLHVAVQHAEQTQRRLDDERRAAEERRRQSDRDRRQRNGQNRHQGAPASAEVSNLARRPLRSL